MYSENEYFMLYCLIITSQIELCHKPITNNLHCILSSMSLIQNARADLPEYLTFPVIYGVVLIEFAQIELCYWCCFKYFFFNRQSEAVIRFLNKYIFCKGVRNIMVIFYQEITLTKFLILKIFKGNPLEWKRCTS